MFYRYEYRAITYGTRLLRLFTFFNEFVALFGQFLGSHGFCNDAAIRNFRFVALELLFSCSCRICRLRFFVNAFLVFSHVIVLKTTCNLFDSSEFVGYVSGNVVKCGLYRACGIGTNELITSADGKQRRLATHNSAFSL